MMSNRAIFKLNVDKSFDFCYNENMIITATEFKVNFGKYLEMATQENLTITKNGKVIAEVSAPKSNAVDALSGIFAGKLNGAPSKRVKDERLREKYGL